MRPRDGGLHLRIAAAGFVLATLTLAVHAEDDPACAVRSMDAWRSEHLARAERILEAANAQPHQDLDMLHVDLDLTIDPSAHTIRGVANLRFKATADLSQVKLRLYRNLQIDCFGFDGFTSCPPRTEDILTFTRKKDDIIFKVTPPMASGSEHEVTVGYSGSPTWDASFLGGMNFTTHASVPVAATESEPYAAYRWWPLVEDVSDKFTVTLHLTVPTGMVGASSGLLVSTVVNPDGTRTFTWEESHPIATYLVNANVTNYAEFSDSYTSLDGNTVMPIDYYVYPEDQALAQQNFTAVPEMIHFFASLTGEYPYLDEKFGQVEVNYPGMEHPTLTAVSQRWTRGDGSYPPGDATLMYAHELAHHWWGDDVTCGSWHDVWLNEGFATYFEALWWAHTQGISEGEAFHWYDIDGQYNGAFEGTVYVKNENKPFKDEMAVYYKGAWVLHMLKKVMGEDHFYEALRHYRALHHYGSATTDDFRAACEDIYGQSLQWFFDQWVFTPKRPVYKMWVALAPGNCVVTLDQVQHHKIAHRTGSDAKVYRMPVDLTLHFDDGTSETHTVWNDQRAQTFSFPVTRVVTSVGFDEDGWLLKVVR